jgi:multidrug efflux pump subunit AcrB
MKAFIEFFAKRPILATLFTLMILLLGLNTLRTIKRMTSTSLENISMIEVVLEPDVKNMDKVKTDLRDAVSRVTDLPAEVTESPLVTEIDTSLINICEVGITGDLPYPQMREIAKQFEKKLEAIPGVSRVENYGYRAREVKVKFSPRAMDRYQIPLREIIGAVKARNIRLTGGAFESYTSEKNVVTLAQFRSSDFLMQPMALALGYGILFATPLTLVLVPCLNTIGNDIRRLLRIKAAGR